MASRTVDLELGDSWAYGPGILHGGSVLELLAAHAVSERHPHPLATTSHFLQAARPGPAQLSVEVLREGRSTSTTRVTLTQGGRHALDAVVTAGLLGEPGTPVHADLVPPVLPPLEQCLRNVPALQDAHNGIADNLDFRVDPATAGWMTGPTDTPEVRGWLRSRVGRELDPLFLVCLADGVPPVPYSMGFTGWVPTVELTVYLRALPAPGWLAAVQRTHHMADGWLDEDCELWDSSGRLVVQARQLAGYRPA